MYNRYIRGENGTFARVRVPAALPHKEAKAKEAEDTQQETGSARQAAPFGAEQGSRFSDTAFLRRILDRLNLKDVDTGDLILLMLLFLLFEENADEELLIAMGLLLIL